MGTPERTETLNERGGIVILNIHQVLCGAPLLAVSQVQQLSSCLYQRKQLSLEKKNRQDMDRRTRRGAGNEGFIIIEDASTSNVPASIDASHLVALRAWSGRGGKRARNGAAERRFRLLGGRHSNDSRLGLGFLGPRLEFFRREVQARISRLEVDHGTKFPVFNQSRASGARVILRSIRLPFDLDTNELNELEVAFISKVIVEHTTSSNPSLLTTKSTGERYHCFNGTP